LFRESARARREEEAREEQSQCWRNHMAARLSVPRHWTDALLLVRFALGCAQKTATGAKAAGAKKGAKAAGGEEEAAEEETAEIPTTTETTAAAAGGAPKETPVAGAAAPTGGGIGATGDIAMTDKPSADETAARAASTVEVTDDTNIAKSQSRSIVRQLEFAHRVAQLAHVLCSAVR